MNIVERPSTDGKKIYYTLEWGRGPGERFSTKIFTYSTPVDKIQKDYNTNALKLLEIMKAQATLDLRTKSTGLSYLFNSKKNFLNFYEVQVDKMGGNKRNHSAAYKKFRAFAAKELNKANDEKLFLSSVEVDELFCENFRQYLLSHLKGETPADYFMSFKRVVKNATKKGYFKDNPAEDVASKKHPSKLKDTIESDEYIQLINADCPNKEVKKAAIVSMYSAFRWCDIQPLRWRQIDFDKDEIKLREQSKTQVGVTVPLHPVVKAILCEPGHPDELVFKLPSHTGAQYSLDVWMTNAKINKRITWHCFRHTVSTILQDQGIHVQVVASYLGQTTAKYILTVYKMRVNAKHVLTAADQLPAIELDTNTFKVLKLPASNKADQTKTSVY